MTDAASPPPRRLRVLALPRYGRLGASSRMRIWQYLPWLEAAGMDVEVRPLLPDSYVEDLQTGRRNSGKLLAAYARQVVGLFNQSEFDLLWVEKEVFPWMPRVLEDALLKARVPRVLDYDDAVYHFYEAHRSSIVRALLRNKHPQAMRNAALVIAGSAFLADRAKLANAPKVVVVPTVVDLERYPKSAPKSTDTAALHVCWIGQQSTAHNLMPYRELFSELSAAGGLKFTAIGIDTAALGLPMEAIPWSESGEVAAVSRCDIGIMPLDDAPFERGKCGYKLIQYMACGLPVIASPVGANRDIVQHGVTGFLAETADEWRDAFSALAASHALRARMGAASRARVEREFSLQVTGPAMAALLRSAVHSRT